MMSKKQEDRMKLKGDVVHIKVVSQGIGQPSNISLSFVCSNSFVDDIVPSKRSSCPKIQRMRTNIKVDVDLEPDIHDGGEDETIKYESTLKSKLATWKDIQN